MTTEYLVDASVAVKWLVAEEDSERTALLLDQGRYRLHAPELIYYEISNVLWRKVKKTEIEMKAAKLAIEKLIDSAVIDVQWPMEAHYLKVLDIAQHLQHGAIYDCAYLALAVDTEMPLITADKKFFNKTRNTKYDVSVELLDNINLS